MGELALEVGGQVDDIDRAERAFLGADTTTNTQLLRDERNLGRRLDLNTELAYYIDKYCTLVLFLLRSFLVLPIRFTGQDFLLFSK